MALMRQFEMTENVQATPLCYMDAGRRGMIPNYNPNAENEDGYHVLYLDGYATWIPKRTFEAFFKLVKGEKECYGASCTN